jgi:glycosyltransferase involved in cell wall biosynthesis
MSLLFESVRESSNPTISLFASSATVRPTTVSGPRAKVVVLVDSLAQGGAERQALEVARRLPSVGFHTVLCTLRDDLAYGHLVPPTLRRYAIGTKNPFAIARKLRAFLLEEKPDVVHSFLDPSNFWNRLVAPGVGRPIVISSVRCRFMRPRFVVVEKLLARRCHAVVVNSVGIERELVRWQRVPASKIRRIGNFVDFERFRPLSEDVRQRVRSRHGLDGPVFFMPGRLSIMKHQLGLAMALGRLKRRGQLPPTARFLFAGRVSQGWTSQLFRLLVRRHGLDDQVRFLGPVTDIEEIYAAADWVILPSLWEGLPNAALEGHACERPLLLSHAANLDGIMADGETGFEFRSGHVEPMAQAILRALAMTAEDARAMGRAGRQRVMERFSNERVMNDLIALYAELLPRKIGSSPCVE